MDKMPVSPDQSAPTDQEGSDQDEQAVVVIELSVMSDGSIQIEHETGQQEGAEEQGGGEEAGDQAPVTVDNIDDALEVVKQMYQASQQSPDEKQAKTKADQMAGYQGQ